LVTSPTDAHSQALHLLQQVVTALAAQLQQLTQEVRALKAVAANTDAEAVTVDVAAALLGASRTTVFRLLRQGKLKRIQGPGRQTLVSRGSVDACLRAPAPAPAPVRAKARSLARPPPLNELLHC
jgi:excisionase family DNA binding protein